MKTLILPYKEARKAAENMWGTGGTTYYKTNRAGCFYFSCSRHGGYIVDPAALTDSERALIDPYNPVEDAQCCNLLMQGGKAINSRWYFEWQRVRGCKYNPALGSVSWLQYPIYTFEEDCAWAVLEKFTDIRSTCRFITETGSLYTEAQRTDAIERTFNMYFANKAA